ncbi:hypothetical protein ACWD5Q_02125 [Streptomyces sp. NPDC002513]
MLHVLSLIAFALLVVLYGAAGGMALTTGRMLLPWRRGHVLRPRLWGSGALTFAAGIAMVRFAVTVSGTIAPDVLAAGGFVLMVAGGVLQFFGQRVGRVQV